MSKLKQIKDLKVGDTVFATNGKSSVSEHKITMIAVESIQVDYCYEGKLTSSDYTAFLFKAERYCTRTFYLDRVKALKEQRKALDNHIQEIYNKQVSFINLIMEINESIRQCDVEIAFELQNTDAMLKAREL